MTEHSLSIATNGTADQAHAAKAGGKPAAPVLVREVSTSGPCQVLGELVSQTEKTIVIRNTETGQETRRGGWKVAEGYIHTEACRCCEDHEQSFYPASAPADFSSRPRVPTFSPCADDSPMS